VVKDTRGKSASVHAWGNDGTDAGNADLTAVCVASQHQLALLFSRPLPRVWRMADADAQCIERAAVRKMAGGWPPG
jgi:hypothetical protein